MMTSLIDAIGKLFDCFKVQKANEIEKMSSQRSILPEGFVIPDHKIVDGPMTEWLSRYHRMWPDGEIFVILAPSSNGKTSECMSFVQNYAKIEKCKALMISGAPKGISYRSWMANMLGCSEECVVKDLLAGMKPLKSSLASILILDEMNEAGVEDCNIGLVCDLGCALSNFAVMPRISIFVITRSLEVAEKLLGSHGRETKTSMRSELMTKIIQSHDGLQDFPFHMSEDGTIDGMTIDDGLKLGDSILEKCLIQERLEDQQK